MYRTRIFLIWAFIALVEFAVIFIGDWFNLYVLKRLRQDIEEGRLDKEKMPICVIRYRTRLNWPLIAMLMAATTVIVFGILHYGEIMRYCFDGLWFGHIFVLFGLIFIYILLGVFLVMVAVFGSEWRRELLVKRYFEKYHVSIE